MKAIWRYRCKLLMGVTLQRNTFRSWQRCFRWIFRRCQELRTLVESDERVTCHSKYSGNEHQNKYAEIQVPFQWLLDEQCTSVQVSLATKYTQFVIDCRHWNLKYRFCIVNESFLHLILTSFWKVLLCSLLSYKVPKEAMAKMQILTVNMKRPIRMSILYQMIMTILEYLFAKICTRFCLE